MDLTDDDIREILDLIDKSKFDFFELEHGELKLTVSKTPMAGTPVRSTRAGPATRDEPPPRTAETPVDIPEGLAGIPAPMVGVFYAGPKPGDPPFVAEGDRVEAETTIGLIEVMKVFTAVTAGRSGVIEKILVADAEGVEYGQILFLIAPDGG